MTIKLKSLSLHKKAYNDLIKLSLYDEGDNSGLYVESHASGIRVYTDLTDNLTPWEAKGVHVKIHNNFQTDFTIRGENTELYCTVHYSDLKGALDFLKVKEVLYVEALQEVLILSNGKEQVEIPIQVMSKEAYNGFETLFYEGIQFHEQDQLLEDSKTLKLDLPKSELKSLLTGASQIIKAAWRNYYPSLYCLNLHKSSMLAAHNSLARRIELQTKLEKEYQVQPEQLDLLRHIVELEGTLDMKINENRDLLFLERQFVKVYLDVPPLQKPRNEQIERLISSSTTTAFSVVDPKKAKKTLKQLQTKGVNKGCFVFPKYGKVFVQAIESDEEFELKGTKLNCNFEQFILNKNLMVEALRSNQFTNVELSVERQARTVLCVLFSTDSIETVVAPIAPQ